jgi:hypothetical protein
MACRFCGSHKHESHNCTIIEQDGTFETVPFAGENDRAFEHRLAELVAEETCDHRNILVASLDYENRTVTGVCLDCKGLFSAQILHVIPVPHLVSEVLNMLSRKVRAAQFN